MQIETTMRHHYTPTRMAIITKTDNTSAGEGKNQNPHTCAGGNVKIVQPLWKIAVPQNVKQKVTI